MKSDYYNNGWDDITWFDKYDQIEPISSPKIIKDRSVQLFPAKLRTEDKTFPEKVNFGNFDKEPGTEDSSAAQKRAKAKAIEDQMSMMEMYIKLIQEAKMKGQK